MTVCAGSRVGPYEILALLGAGGTGEVYRASDTRLGREVAIKVPPAGFAADPERLRRFEQEARAIALPCAPSHSPRPRQARRPQDGVRPWKAGPRSPCFNTRSLTVSGECGALRLRDPL